MASDTQFENPQVRKNCRKDMLSKRESEGTDGTVKPEAVDGSNSQDGSQPTQVSDQDCSSPSAPANTIEEDPAITRKREKLLADNSRLEAEIEKVIREQEELRAKLKSKDADKLVKDHIELLHQYNEIKDVATGLIGLVAENRGVRLQDIMEEYGVANLE